MRNSHELIIKIKNIDIPNNAILVSFDVPKCLLSIPPKGYLEILKN